MNIFLYTMCDMGWLLPWLLPFLIGFLLAWSMWGKWKNKYKELDKNKSNYKTKLAKLDEQYKEERRLKNKFKKDLEKCKADNIKNQKIANVHGKSLTKEKGYKKSQINDKSLTKDEVKSLRNDSGDLDLLKKELLSANDKMQKMQEEMSSAMNELINLKSISMNIGDKNALEEARKKAEDLERQLERVKNEKRHLETANQELKSTKDANEDTFPILEIYSHDDDYTSSYNELNEDDLQIFEGIGPEIEEVLNASGIHNWKDLATHHQDDLKPIFTAKGMIVDSNIEDWVTQARFAVSGDWDGLVDYQKNLNGVDKFSTSLTNSKLHKLKLSMDERLRRYGKSDFVVIDGINKKLANLLAQSGLKTLGELAKAPQDTVKIILQINGINYDDDEIANWKKQAELIIDKDWIELDKFQKSIQKE